MEYTKLGRTDIEVSRLAFGSWQVAGWVTSDDSHFIQNLKAALDLGITLFDTAEAYGNGKAEELISQVITGGIRHATIIATKFSHKNASPEKMRLSLEGSLRRLKTDYIDLYQYHWPAAKISSESVLEELLKFKKEGKIRCIGVSNWMEPEWDEIKDPSLIEASQPCYNLLWRSIENKVLPICAKHNIAVLPYSPLAQGLLTGRFKKTEEVPTDVRKNSVLIKPEKFTLVLKILNLVDELSKLYKKTPAQIALRWLLDNKLVTAPIIGASSKLQLEENIAALGWKLEQTHLDMLNEISLPLSKDLKPHDTLWDWHPRGK